MKCLIYDIELWQHQLQHYFPKLHMFLLWHWTVQPIFVKRTLFQHWTQQRHSDNSTCQCWDAFWKHSINNSQLFHKMFIWGVFFVFFFTFLNTAEPCFIIPLIALNQKMCPENEDGCHHIWSWFSISNQKENQWWLPDIEKWHFCFISSPNYKTTLNSYILFIFLAFIVWILFSVYSRFWTTYLL